MRISFFFFFLQDSEESDMEINDDRGQGGNITSQMISEWEEKLRSARFVQFTDPTFMLYSNLPSGTQVIH